MGTSRNAWLTAVEHAAISVLTSRQYKLVKFPTPEQVSAYRESLEAAARSAQPTGIDPNELMTAKEVEDLLRIEVKTDLQLREARHPAICEDPVERPVSPPRDASVDGGAAFKPGSRGPRK